MPPMFGFWRNSPALILATALGAGVLFFATPAPALELPELEELETLLRDLGFDPGEVDGVVDDDTRAAIQRYQDFALLAGDPEPSAKLLDELRGVAAAFAALSAGEEEDPSPLPPEETAPENEPAPLPAAEKVLVPPPPPPPKLKPLEVATEEELEEELEEQVAAPDQLAALPPAAETASETAPAPESDAEPIDEAQARIDAELVPYRENLEDGSLNRQTLARQFNDEGRAALQRADYAAAVLKFSVAIHLDPGFAGAYSNRGTAYQRQEEADLAAADFKKAKELGFGGLRLRDGKNPFN